MGTQQARDGNIIFPQNFPGFARYPLNQLGVALYPTPALPPLRLFYTS